MAGESQLTFLPWARTGLAAAVPAAAAGASRASVEVALSLNPGGAAPGPVTVELLGPGDVTGLDGSQVLRTDPADGAPNFEASHFPLVEFASPHLPWLFTPAGPAGNQLTPWITLIAVEVQDGVALTADAAHAVTVLAVGPPASAQAELPDLTQAWAWAHIQMTGLDDPADSAAIAKAVQSGTGCLSRLVCPRQLKPGRRYLACVVPVFAAGRAAALGEPPPAGGPVWAWTGEQSVRLPVYFSFSFTTASEGGDFQTLAQLIRAIDPGAGLLPELQPGTLDLSAPGFPVAWAAGDSTQLPLPSVLRFSSAKSPAVPAAFTQAITSRLRQAGGPDLPLPLYGAVQADVAATGQWPAWLAELNCDPRLRVAAGWGADIVRQDRDSLAGAAFAQAGDALAANQVTGHGHLAATAAALAQNRHIAPLDPLSQLQVTAPAHTRAQIQDPRSGATVTIAALLQAQAGSPSLPAMVSPAYRRLTRPRGPFAARTPPPPPVPIPAGADGTPIAGQNPASPLLTAISPAAALAQRLSSRITTAAAVAARPFAAVAVPVSFPAPMFTRLAALNPAAILPGAGGLPNNTVAGLLPDPAAIASFLAGLNSEASRELVWQGVPVDRRATFFRQFWDTSAQTASAPDIAPIASWDPASTLAGNMPSGQASWLLLVIRADLLRRYPETVVLAIPAAGGGTAGPADDTQPGVAQLPMFTGFLPPATRYLAFGIPAADAPSWYFAFQEQVSYARFHSGTLATAPPAGSAYYPVQGGWASAADAAAATYDPPHQVIIPGSELFGAGL
jgi:hypothetical protein